MLDVANMLSVAEWSGELHVASSEAQYRISLSRGNVTHASSTLRAHRLGEWLERQGTITAQQLAECVQALGPHKRIGEALVDRGLISQQALFEALRQQTVQIVHAALMVEAGRFIFMDATDDAGPPPVRFHLPVQHLLLEGARRIDEMRRFRSKIHDGDLCPELVGSQRTEATAVPAELLDQMDGATSIRQLADRLGMDEFEVTKLVFELVEQGRVQMRTAALAAEDSAVALVDAFNGVLRIIFAAAACYECADGVHARVQSWLADTTLATCLGDCLREDGGVDATRVIEHARAGATAGSLYRSLHELTTFALFATGPSLPRPIELELAREVALRLQRIEPAARH